MPSIIGHALVGAALAEATPRIGRGAGFGRGGWTLILAAVSIAPDLDSFPLMLGLIRYASPFGHRGATHSLAFALLLAVAVTALVAWRSRGSSENRGGWRVGSVLALAGASHGLLDMLTDAGLGVAWGYPFASTRHFFAVRPIPAAAVGFELSAGVFLTEVLLLGPLLLAAAVSRRTVLRPWPRAVLVAVILAEAGVCWGVRC
ncbi:MAG: metal-dependent hydrolase [Planctomycetes bacterium]|nr:metal-dependent hydrolase [Planctomycetota bacterium]